MSQFINMWYGMPILLLGYITCGYLVYHLAKFFHFMLTFITRWGNREKLRDNDWARSMDAYDLYGTPMFASEPVFSVFWPIGVVFMLCVIPISISSAAYTRYLSEVSLKKINNSYTLRPRWLTVKSFIAMLNRFI